MTRDLKHSHRTSSLYRSTFLSESWSDWSPAWFTPYCLRQVFTVAPHAMVILIPPFYWSELNSTADFSHCDLKTIATSHGLTEEWKSGIDVVFKSCVTIHKFHKDLRTGRGSQWCKSVWGQRPENQVFKLQKAAEERQSSPLGAIPLPHLVV